MTQTKTVCPHCGKVTVYATARLAELLTRQGDPVMLAEAVLEVFREAGLTVDVFCSRECADDGTPALEFDGFTLSDGTVMCRDNTHPNHLLCEGVQGHTGPHWTQGLGSSRIERW